MLNGVAPRGGERWATFSLYLPGPADGGEQWDPDARNNDVVFQIHAFPDPDENRAVPPLSMNSSSGDWMIFEATDADPSLADDEYDRIGEVWRAPYETGVWTDWVYHFRFSPDRDDPDGLLEVWKDGERVVDRHGITLGRHDAGASNFKTGVSKPAGGGGGRGGVLRVAGVRAAGGPVGRDADRAAGVRVREGGPGGAGGGVEGAVEPRRRADGAVRGGVHGVRGLRRAKRRPPGCPGRAAFGRRRSAGRLRRRCRCWPRRRPASPARPTFRTGFCRRSGWSASGRRCRSSPR